jgi:hypothetical protein
VSEQAARRAAQQSHARYERLREDAAELDRLRAALATRPTTPVEQVNLVGDLNASLVEAGIPVSSLVNLTPDSDSAVAGAQAGIRAAAYHRQGARVTIEQATLPQVGRLLASWRRAHPRWRIASLQMQPMARTAEAKTAENAQKVQQPLRVYLVIESTYLSLPAEGQHT